MSARLYVADTYARMVEPSHCARGVITAISLDTLLARLSFVEDQIDLIKMMGLIAPFGASR